MAACEMCRRLTGSDTPGTKTPVTLYDSREVKYLTLCPVHKDLIFHLERGSGRIWTVYDTIEVYHYTDAGYYFFTPQDAD
jgi:hypothetical protein